MEITIRIRDIFKINGRDYENLNDKDLLIYSYMYFNKIDAIFCDYFND